jgi:hypothetical protein
MAHEKQYTAKQAALAVLEKVGEILKKSEIVKSDLAKARVDNELGLGANDKRIARAYRKLTTVKPATEGPTPNLPKSEDLQKCSGCGGMYKSEAKIEKCEQHASLGKSELESDFENLKGLLKAEPKGEIHPKEKQAGEEEKVGERIQEQKDPQHNAKEQAEGNNELAGTTPTQVGQDGKNKPGYDEMKGHLKLAKFIGRMEYKRLSKKGMPNG